MQIQRKFVEREEYSVEEASGRPKSYVFEPLALKTLEAKAVARVVN